MGVLRCDHELVIIFLPLAFIVLHLSLVSSSVRASAFALFPCEIPFRALPSSPDCAAIARAHPALEAGINPPGTTNNRRPWPTSEATLPRTAARGAGFISLDYSVLFRAGGRPGARGGQPSVSQRKSCAPVGEDVRLLSGTTPFRYTPSEHWEAGYAS